MEEDLKLQTDTHVEWSSEFHLYEQKMLQALWSLYLFRPSPQQKPAQASRGTAVKMAQHQQEASLSSSSQADS